MGCRFFFSFYKNGKIENEPAFINGCITDAQLLVYFHASCSDHNGTGLICGAIFAVNNKKINIVPGQLVGSHQACGACTDDDDIVVIHLY